MTELALRGEAREVVLAEVQAVRAHAQDEQMRHRFADLAAAVDAGEIDDEEAELLESVLELGLQTGRVRAYYGPGGEQAALGTVGELPRGGLRVGCRARATCAWARTRAGRGGSGSASGGTSVASPPRTSSAGFWSLPRPATGASTPPSRRRPSAGRRCATSPTTRSCATSSS